MGGTGPASDAGAAGEARPDGWSARHGGLQASGVVLLWLGGMQRLARTHVLRRVPPDVLSAAGVVTAVGGVATAATGGRWPLLAAALVVLVGVLDGLDGAVALVSGRPRPLGAVIDATADRVTDVLLAVALLVLGAPPAWCAVAGALTLLHEYVRARAQAAGMPGIGAVTVAERPTRIILVAVACAGAGLAPAGTPWLGWDWATVCVFGWVVAGAVGLAQLVRGVLRSIPSAGG